MPLNSGNIILLGLKVLGIAETTAKKFPFFSFLLPKNKTKKNSEYIFNENNIN